MRWFKHLTASSDDPFIVDLEVHFGLEGYARWWKLLEAVASQVDAKAGRWTVAYPWAKWQQILQGKRKKLEQFLTHLEQAGKIEIWGDSRNIPGTFPEHSRNVSGFSDVSSGNVIEIGIRNLKKYMDEYSKKSGQTPDQLRTKETEAEEETEKRKDLPLSPPTGGVGTHTKASRENGANPRAVGKNPRAQGNAPRSGGYTPSFEAFWELYPRKVGKIAAYKAWQKVGKGKLVQAKTVIEAIRNQVDADHFRGNDGQVYIKNPATWLNQGCWEDEIRSGNGDNILDDWIPPEERAGRNMQ